MIRDKNTQHTRTTKMGWRSQPARRKSVLGSYQKKMKRMKDDSEKDVKKMPDLNPRTDFLLALNIRKGGLRPPERARPVQNTPHPESISKGNRNAV